MFDQSYVFPWGIGLICSGNLISFWNLADYIGDF